MSLGWEIHICLLQSCDHRLHELFNETMIYLKPALTPLSLFSTSDDEILQYEGPQTVNTGVALCSVLGAQNVVLVGVDLGSANLEKVQVAKLLVVCHEV